jgi:hypothetical protein
VLTPRLGEPVQPLHAETPDPWWRAAGGVALPETAVPDGDAALEQLPD